MGINIGTVFEINRTQSARLPAATRFPDSVKRVVVRVVGRDRALSPADSSWDSFFADGPQVSEDFMVERADQVQADREQLLEQFAVQVILVR